MTVWRAFDLHESSPSLRGKAGPSVGPYRILAGSRVPLIGLDKAALPLMGNAGILRRQRKKPDFFNVSEAAQQGLASKPAEPVQDETPEIVVEVCVFPETTQIQPRLCACNLWLSPAFCRRQNPLLLTQRLRQTSSLPARHPQSRSKESAVVLERRRVRDLLHLLCSPSSALEDAPGRSQLASLLHSQHPLQMVKLDSRNRRSARQDRLQSQILCNPQ